MNYYNENDPKAAAWLRELIRQKLIPAGDVDTRSITDVSPHELTGYTQQHFFAGIGGWSLALALAGWPANRPVRTGSCPCQPFSAAGKGMGESDARHLWPVFRDLVAFGHPTETFGEQVASAAGRVWLARVRSDLEGLGYAVGAADLCSAGVGSPNRRQRIYWLGYPNGNLRRTGRRREKGNAGLRSIELAGSSEASRLDNADSDRAQRERGAKHITDPRGEVGRLANADGGNAGAKRKQRGWKHGQQPADSRADAMGDANGSGFSEQRRPFSISTQQLAPELRGNFGYWSDFDLLPCTDGKTRRIEPGSFSMANGVSSAMDAVWNACLSEIKTKVEIYATFTITDPEEVLREMRKGINPSEIHRTLGGPDRLSEAALLFAALCELKGQLGRVEHRETQRISEEQATNLRGVWESIAQKERAPCSSQGREYTQQLANELGDAVRKLPQEAAQYFFNGFPLIGKTFGRVGLLRGYGNAINPFVAAEFIKSYLDIFP